MSQPPQEIGRDQAPQEWTFSYWGGPTFDEGRLKLSRLEPGEKCREHAAKLVADILGFVRKYCTCSYCGRRPSTPVAPCVCNKAFWLNEDEITVSFSREMHGNVLERIARRQHQRVAAVARGERLRDAEGVHLNKAQKALLLQVQDGLCYYCGCPMEGRHQHDHFVALACGGRRDLENAVLSCARCNTRKSHGRGSQFIAKSDASSSDAAAVKAMRSRMDVWRKSQGFRPLATLERLGSGYRRW